MSAYETDGYAWAMEQAAILRRRSANEVDWDSVAEEIEDVGKSISRELRSRYEILIVHLLKWIYQPQRRGRSWADTMDVQRTAIALHVADNPSLKAVEDAEFLKAYRLARAEAAKQTRLDKRTFPEHPPFTLEEAVTEDWLPADRGDDG